MGKKRVAMTFDWRPLNRPSASADVPICRSARGVPRPGLNQQALITDCVYACVSTWFPY